MTSQVVFNIDSKIKAKAMKRAKRAGIPFASYLRQAAEDFAEGKRGMAIVEEKFNEKTARELRAALRDIEKGKNLSPVFSSGKEMDKYLGI
ncbi:MAG: hypothetical protein Q7R71_02005 [bacterium]|nr:hypothetical protein [bacterium]